MLLSKTYHPLIKSQCLMEVRSYCNITGEKGEPNFAHLFNTALHYEQGV